MYKYVHRRLSVALIIAAISVLPLMKAERHANIQTRESVAAQAVYWWPHGFKTLIWGVIAFALIGAALFLAGSAVVLYIKIRSAMRRHPSKKIRYVTDLDFTPDYAAVLNSMS